MSSIRHPTFHRNQKKKKKYEARKVGRGKGPRKRKAKRQEKFRKRQCEKKKLAYVRWQIKILYSLVCNLGEVYLFGKNSFLSKTKNKQLKPAFFGENLAVKAIKKSAVMASMIRVIQLRDR